LGKGKHRRHEAVLRLGDQPFENRAHFFSAAAEAMRRILVDASRRKHAMRRGSGELPLDVDEIDRHQLRTMNCSPFMNQRAHRAAALDLRACMVARRDAELEGR